MQFGNLEYLWLLLLIPALALFFIFVFARRRAAMAQFAPMPLMQLLVRGVSRGKQRAKPAMVLLAVLLIIVALLEPMWGYHQVQVQREAVDIAVAIDTSRSMLTQDVKPSRMDLAKLKVIDLMRILDGDRIALIAFAGEAYIKCPLTEDYDTAEMLLRDIDVGAVREGSTDIGRAIRRGIMAFHTKERKHKVLILITDGEDHGRSALAMAAQAGKEGVVIITVGIGTKMGDHIWIGGKKLKDKDGNDVRSRLDETLLAKIPETANAERAKLSGELGREAGVRGHYIPAYDPNWSLENACADVLGSMEKRKLGPRWVKKYQNRYQWPLLFAAILLTAEALVSERKRETGKRRRERWNDID